ncbi:MAG: DNA/RNA nuclease SfsA [Thermoleophilia bacterium]
MRRYKRFLADIVVEGHRALVFFAVMRGDTRQVRPADNIDPVFGRLQSRRGLDQISVFYHQRLSGSFSRPRALRLFPPDPEWLDSLTEREWPSRSRPVFTMDWHQHLLPAPAGADAGEPGTGVRRIAAERERQPPDRNAGGGAQYQ